MADTQTLCHSTDSAHSEPDKQHYAEPSHIYAIANTPPSTNIAPTAPGTTVAIAAPFPEEVVNELVTGVVAVPRIPPFELVRDSDA